MKTKIFPINPFEMNCYVYYDEIAKEGVIIDPGVYTDSEKEDVRDFVASERIAIKYVLLTHGHIDHILGSKWAKDTYSVPMLMHKSDLRLVHKAPEQGEMFGMDFPEPPEPDKYINENDVITFGNCELKVLHTPGHSPGGVCFVDEKEKIMFVGDSIFKSSIGRTDLWGGDTNALLDSIKNKIFKYDDDFVLYPGHYEETTIGEEKKYNPFLG